MTFRIALSGLNAASSALSVTANNIANANTTGFKESRAQFADLFNSGSIGLFCGSTCAEKAGRIVISTSSRA